MDVKEYAAPAVLLTLDHSDILKTQLRGATGVISKVLTN